MNSTIFLKGLRMKLLKMEKLSQVLIYLSNVLNKSSLNMNRTNTCKYINKSVETSQYLQDYQRGRNLLGSCIYIFEVQNEMDKDRFSPSSIETH